jgi:ribosomal protein L5
MELARAIAEQLEEITKDQGEVYQAEESDMDRRIRIAMSMLSELKRKKEEMPFFLDSDFDLDVMKIAGYLSYSASERLETGNNLLF